jgi:hypothetical protein
VRVLAGDDERPVRPARGWDWIVRHLAAAMVFAVGVIAVLAVMT